MSLSIILSLTTFIAILTTITSIVAYSYESRRVKRSNGIFDFVDLAASCPKSGAMKNFRFMVTSSEVYYQMQCYGSRSTRDYDDVIINEVTQTLYTEYDICLDNRFMWIDRHIPHCPIDFALSSFTLEHPKYNQCRFKYQCVAVKSIDEDKDITAHKTPTETGAAGAMTGLTKLRVGNTESEAAAINTMKLQMNYSISDMYIYYAYGLIKLRDMTTVKEDYLVKSKALRDNNNEKD